MSASSVTRRLLPPFEVLLLLATVSAVPLVGGAHEWTPIALSILLIALALFSEWFSVELSDGTLSASTIAIVLAMGLLGPAPAAACGVAAVVISSASRRVRLRQWMNNLATFAAVPFGGGLAVRALISAFHVDHGSQGSRSVALGLILLAVFVATLVVNFTLIGLRTLAESDRSLRRQLPEFLPLLPGELAAGLLAAILAAAYRAAGMPTLIAAIVVLLIFQHLTVALLRSEERAEQLHARSRQLVGLQLGVLRTLVRALELRDQTSAKHAASVAAYATAFGRALKCDEAELDVLRAAGLLHEIGKFTWPDRVLHAETIAPEDQSIVESHPQVGSVLVGALDGYGPVADAILYHHERSDGRGYPAGLIGSEIPFASRVLAICSTYDTMTSSHGYRSPMAHEEAIEELRVAARNGQLDAELVESFVSLLQSGELTLEGEPDFEEGLEFERRVQEMAEPSSGEGPKAPVNLGREWLGRRSGVP